MSNLVPLANRLPVMGDTLSQYLREIKQFPLLEAEEEYSLAKDFKSTGNIKSAHKLVTSHLRLVAKIAKGYRGYGLALGDIISEGNIGLMHAVKRFDPDKGFRFSTYAMWWVRAMMQEYILRSWSLVKIGTNAAQKKLFFNLRRLKNKIQHTDNPYLSSEETKQIASELNVKEKEVSQMEGRMQGGDLSLNAPLSHEGEKGEWQDWIEEPHESQEEELAEKSELEERKKILMAAIATLNEREQKIIMARKMKEPPSTLEELSSTFSISRERVRQIEARALEKLRQEVQKTKLD